MCKVIQDFAHLQVRSAMKMRLSGGPGCVDEGSLLFNIYFRMCVKTFLYRQAFEYQNHSNTTTIIYDLI